MAQTTKAKSGKSPTPMRKCDMCGLVTAQLFYHHLRAHSLLRDSRVAKLLVTVNKPKRRLICDECDKSFEAFPNLIRHLKHKHFGKMEGVGPRRALLRIYCDDCGFETIHENRHRTLATHMSHFHGYVSFKEDIPLKTATIAKRRYTCDVCLYDTSTPRELHRHSMQIHSAAGLVASKPLSSCDQCGKSTTALYSLYFHWIRQHYFAPRTKIVAMTRIKTLKSHCCDECGKVVSNSWRLKCHLALKHFGSTLSFEIVKTKACRITCDDCGKQHVRSNVHLFIAHLQSQHGFDNFKEIVENRKAHKKALNFGYRSVCDECGAFVSTACDGHVLLTHQMKKHGVRCFAGLVAEGRVLMARMRSMPAEPKL